MQLRNDPAVLAREAGNFERISNELKNVIAKVESTTDSLSGMWKGQAADAAKGALQRFHDAASKQVQELNDISNNIHAAASQYSAADEAGAGSLASTMGQSLG